MSHQTRPPVKTGHTDDGLQLCRWTQWPPPMDREDKAWCWLRDAKDYRRPSEWTIVHLNCNQAYRIGVSFNELDDITVDWATTQVSLIAPPILGHRADVLTIDEFSFTPDLDRFRMWWVDAPDWLKQAHHNDTLVHRTMLDSLDKGLDDRETLLRLVRVLLDRDRDRLKTIEELQYPLREVRS